MYKKRILDLRNENNLKQQELAKVLNLAKTTYNNYENEYEIMPIKHLNTLCNYFGVSLDYIFEFTNIRVYENMISNIDNNTSGGRIKSLRKSKGLTQHELANFLNTEQTTISKYEKGIYTISTTYLYAICKKYNISADYLLGKLNLN